MLGNAEVVQALVKLKSYLDYGMFQPVQIAATVTLNEAADFPKEICAIYERRCDALIDGLGQDRVGRPQAGRLDVRVGADPRALRRDGLGRVLLDAGQGLQRRAVARRRVRPGRRGLRPVRPDRERASASSKAFATCARASPNSDSRARDGPPGQAGERRSERRRRAGRRGERSARTEALEEQSCSRHAAEPMAIPFPGAHRRHSRLVARPSRRGRSGREPDRRGEGRRARDRDPRGRRWAGRRRVGRGAARRRPGRSAGHRGARHRRRVGRACAARSRATTSTVA